MEKNDVLKDVNIPVNDSDTNESASTDTIPENDKKITIPVKYNKEIKEIDVETAVNLAQKGMKYDVIKQDYELLKELARKENKSVPEYLSQLESTRIDRRRKELIEKCGGDSELAEHIVNLENSNQTENLGFKELSDAFPKFKDIEDIPKEVVENAKARGTLLLDEYLRFKLKDHLNLNAAVSQQKKAENLSLGSQQNRQGSLNPETEEFIKGLWK